MTDKNQEIFAKGLAGFFASYFSEITLEDFESCVEIGVQLMIGAVTLYSFIRNIKKDRKNGRSNKTI